MGLDGTVHRIDGRRSVQFDAEGKMYFAERSPDEEFDVGNLQPSETTDQERRDAEEQIHRQREHDDRMIETGSARVEAARSRLAGKPPRP